MVPGPAYGAGYLTSEAPYVTLADGLPRGSSVRAIISSGDEVDGVNFQGLPDGIGLAPGAVRGTVDVYVAHEQSTVPFLGFADFEDSSVTKLTLSTRAGMRGSVLSAEVALSPDDGYLRFCSASMAGPEHGFSNYTFLTGEETNDIVALPANAPYRPDPSLRPLRQGGYAVALDIESGRSAPITDFGRLNHENSLPLPNRGEIALLSTDDTFDGPSSQLYLYLADNQKQVFNSKGEMYAFRVTATDAGPVNPADPFNGANDYLDIQPGDSWQGEFIPVPEDIARGLTDEAPQAALENWSNDNNVFQFIRLEDLDYDKNDPNVVYVADTGRSRVVPDPATGRLVRGPSGTVGFADNGRVFKFVLDPTNPRVVTSLSILADGDNPGWAEYVPFTSPDNVGTSVNSLMIQEDTDEASVWRMDLASGAWGVVATVNDPAGESSGIVDASAWFGPGTWLLDVQAHGSNVAEETIGDVTYKQEAGQLMLMRIPGS
jgi:hypothetical protein